MTDVLRGGAEASRRRSGARRPAAGIALALGALEWRQRYANADEYPLELPTVPCTLSLRQRMRGELTGLGTGATVWPAAHVLARYLERRFACKHSTRSQV